MKKILAALLLSIPMFALVPVVAMGETGSVGGTPGTPLISKPIVNPIKTKTLSGLVAQIISTIITIAYPFLVFAFIYVGFLFVKARGNPDEISDARAALVWTAVGAFILLGAWGFSKVLENTVGALQ